MWLSSVQIRPLFCLRVGDTDLGRGTYWKVYSQPGCAYSVIYIISTWLVVRLACHWVTFSSSLVLGVPKMLLGFLPVLCRLVIIHIYIYIYIYNKCPYSPSGRAMLWQHRFFVGFSSWCRPFTYWDWSDIVIWYLFPTSQWCCNNNVVQCKTLCYTDTNFQCPIDIR